MDAAVVVRNRDPSTSDFDHAAWANSYKTTWAEDARISVM
eukprot:CAMPEP_0198148138 /NCGR_PEP_ID=MMETSP1443-20131203/40041_1 /TAXON_ID=186043 /ORGANISM="Entomoneis sp., Strain CCMP2396" /LENGTH=39 /DNA_ID= /DNA_START= /DNA_END= /DNA_ORIENTATION=